MPSTRAVVTLSDVTYSSAEGRTCDRQRAAMMAEIARAPNVRQAAIDNAPGLTETAVEFVKRQSAFVHKVMY